MRSLVVFVLLTTSALAGPAQLARERATLADKAYKSAVARHKGGRATVDVVRGWSVRLLESELDSGKSAKRAFADHVTRMKDLEVEAAKARDAGAATSDEADGATYFRLEAEYWQARGRR